MILLKSQGTKNRLNVQDEVPELRCCRLCKEAKRIAQEEDFVLCNAETDTLQAAPA